MIFDVYRYKPNDIKSRHMESVDRYAIQPTEKIHPFSKMAVTFEPKMKL